MKLVIAVAALFVLGAAASARAADVVESHLTMARGSTLSITDLNGPIFVRRGDRFALRATKTAQHGNPDDVRITVLAVAGGVEACVHYPGDAGNDCRGVTHDHSVHDNDTKVTFDVSVPDGVDVDARTVNGEITATTAGSVAATTVNGKIAIDAIDVTRATTVNGSLDITVRGGSSRPVTLTTVNGSLTCRFPRDAGLAVRASVLNGSIDAEGLAVHRPQYGPGAHADGRLGDGRRELEMRTLNGNIRIERA